MVESPMDETLKSVNSKIMMCVLDDIVKYCKNHSSCDHCGLVREDGRCTMSEYPERWDINRIAEIIGKS